ncbi:MAG: hypothetical protein ACRDC4_00765 [Plesiomonas sp.]
MTDEERIADLRENINDLNRRKKDIAEFLARPKTTDSQREVFTLSYADLEGEILNQQQAIRRINMSKGK